MSGWQVQLRGALGSLAVDVTFGSEDVGPLVLTGPNGSGKTAVLRTIAGADTGLEGRVTLGELVLMDTDRGVASAPEDRGVGYVPQGFALFPHLNVLGNVTFGCGSDPAAADRARITLEELDAAHLLDREPRTLSGGEQQRVALARALVTKPQGLLLDEPLSALDVGQRRRMRALLVEYLRRGSLPAIIVTHDLRDVLALGGTVVVIEAGRVVQTGTAEALAADPSSDFVAELFELVEPVDSDR